MGKIGNVMLNSAEKALEVDRRRDDIMKRWLSGWSVGDISQHYQLDRKVIILDLNAKRTELREFQNQDVQELAAERIEGLRLIQKDAVSHMTLTPRAAASLLTVRLRAEETIAKIQGVLNEKVIHLGRIVHHVKTYDFDDNFPEAVVEGLVTTIEEPELAQLPPALEIDADSNRGILANLDGELVIPDIYVEVDGIVITPQPLPEPTPAVAKFPIINTAVGTSLEL